MAKRSAWFIRGQSKGLYEWSMIRMGQSKGQGQQGSQDQALEEL